MNLKTKGRLWLRIGRSSCMRIRSIPNRHKDILHTVIIFMISWVVYFCYFAKPYYSLERGLNENDSFVALVSLIRLLLTFLLQSFDI